MLFKRPEILRPPSEWRSYYLPVTFGCSNNTCTFCNFHGVKLQMREVAEVKREIDAVALYHQSGIQIPDMPYVVYAIAQHWDGKKVFLQDGDALVYPFPELKEVLEYLNQKFPRLERVGVYATPGDMLRIGVDELRTLRELKLGIIYMGMESGDDEVLRKVQKGAKSQQIVEAGRKIKEAGILSSITVILGLGGVEGSEKHALATSEGLSEADPDYAGALTLTVVPGTPLYQEWQDGRFHLISPFRSLEELKIMVENSSFSKCFFSSMHASNYFSIRGTLPRDKGGMLRQLESMLAKRDPRMLRPEFLRGL
ncbi:MAG: radical SAM protein [Dehalococcoidia bacterium]|nr:radical SAM protein [Dehalococcoidia bacterium]